MHMQVPEGVLFVNVDARVLVRMGVLMCIGWILMKYTAEFFRWIIESLWTCELRVQRRHEGDQDERVSMVVHPVAVAPARAGYEIGKHDGV